jgi:hypothetical protein
MSQQVERVRSEVRSESLHQLQDVTQMFLQNLNYGKLVHANAQTVETAEADVQTDAPPPPPALPPSGVAVAVAVKHTQDVSKSSSIPEDDLSHSTDPHLVICSSNISYAPSNKLVVASALQDSRSEDPCGFDFVLLKAFRITCMFDLFECVQCNTSGQ